MATALRYPSRLSRSLFATTSAASGSCGTALATSSIAATRVRIAVLPRTNAAIAVRPDRAVVISRPERLLRRRQSLGPEHGAVEAGLQQLRLRVEREVDGLDRYARAGGDVGHPRTDVPGLGEHLGRGDGDALARRSGLVRRVGLAGLTAGMTGVRLLVTTH